MLRQKHALPLIIAVLLLSACSGTQHSLHDAAIAREMGRANLEAKTIDVHGMEIAVLESERLAGQETLVLIHGFGGNSHSWIRLAQQLKQDYHLVIPDLPGHGRSVQDPTLHYGIPDQVEYLSAILEALNVQSAHFAGNSMGGAISALYANTFPQQVLSLSLINPAGVRDYPSELDEHLARGENPLVVEQASDYGDLLNFVMEKRPFIPWPISSVMAERAAENREINEKIFADIRSAPWEDFRELLPTITAPTLILWGRQDRVINVDNGKVFDALIPNSTLVIFDDIGHVPMVEAPKRTAVALRQLMNGSLSAIPDEDAPAKAAATSQ